ncbi:ribosomal protection-like ABC-F family protein [Lentilactobacillus parakefiri]|uniref:ABC-F type ribosomal protection protein n=1 Tax=Lentilactobacillus parakefiri TaxID=152332 RepID=A0A269YJN0_9LACO|nr:ATP-binding cassette domain-containing protein [Lentilactobacillus parakefiri]PAK85629.1 ABC-F type ribosomal protection protein [Lentilactobacillus parakefiri]
MGRIQIRNLSFSYDGMLTNLFDRLNLNIDESWRLGLIGRNGRGKTTFLKLLLGQLTYRGQLKSSVDFIYFPQPIPDATQVTGDVLLRIAGLDESELWKIQIEMDKLQLTDEILSRPFETLSPGEQIKAGLAVMFIDNQTFQLIDEPTNHLDIEGREVVADYLKQKQGFIVVSHDRHFLDQVIDHVLSIDRAKVQLYAGNYETWATAYQQENRSEWLEKRHLQKEIGRLKSTADTIERWAGRAESQKRKSVKSDQHADLDKGFIGHKTAKVMKRSKSTLRRTEKEIEQKQSLLKNVDEAAPLQLNYERPYQKYLLQVAHLQVQQNGAVLNQPLSFNLMQDQCLVLFGQNGVGKTTIIKAILGDHQLVADGTVEKPAGIRISYLNQNFERLKGSIQDYADQFSIKLNDLLNTLRKLGFERSAFAEYLSDLSMGQKRKVSLARSLCERANLYIWDEPLNYLDVITRQQIQDLILQIRPSMLIIDHDEAFIETVKTGPLLRIKPGESK